MHIKIEYQLNVLTLNKFSPKGDRYSRFTQCESHECVPWQPETYCDSISILNTNSYKNIFIPLFSLH